MDEGSRTVENGTEVRRRMQLFPSRSLEDWTEARLVLQHTLYSDLMTPSDRNSSHEEMLGGAARSGRADLMLAETTVLSGCSRLHQAVLGGWDEEVSTLLSEGADLEASTITGRTPLHWAADLGNYRAAQFLLEAGADPQARCMFGFYPRCYASRSGHGDIELLLQEYMEQ